MNDHTKEALQELKHAIRFHLEIMTQPTAQLGAYLVKMVDFLEDEDDDRLTTEIQILANALTESTALYVQKALDEREERAVKQSQPWPSEIKKASGNILVAIGQSKQQDDKVAARKSILLSVSKALKALGDHTKADYPKITGTNGTELV